MARERTPTALARGDRAAAKEALARARDAKGSADPELLEAMAAVLIQVGETAAAREMAAASSQRWPKRTAGYITLAQVALAEDKPQQALDALEKAGDLSGSPVALCTIRLRLW